MANDEQLLRLARTRLSDYSYAEAVAAFIEILDCSGLSVPEDLLAAAARQHLEILNTGGEADPCRVLREIAAAGG